MPKRKIATAVKSPPEKYRRVVVVATLLLLLAVPLASCGASSSSSQDQSTADRSTDEQTASSAPSENAAGDPVTQVAEQLGPSVVQVNVNATQPTPFGPQRVEGLGSGVIYRTDGYIVTNSHVVQDAKQANVTLADGSTEQGDVVGSDQFTDVAVIRVDRTNLPPAKFGESGNLIVGQLAVAIGNASGLQSTVSSGVISGLNREVPARFTGGRQDISLVDLIQTDAPISPGSSGGALAVRSGDLIGITVAYLPPAQTGAQRIGFAIPADTVTSVANQLIQTGRASTPYLGASLTDLSPDIAQQFGLRQQSGALVVEVESNGPADKAGLKPQDVVSAAGSKTVKSSGELVGALRSYKPGDTIQLTVLRGGTEQTIDVVVGERQGGQPTRGGSSR
jgi:S1-C subfamily serine protease